MTSVIYYIIHIIMGHDLYYNPAAVFKIKTAGIFSPLLLQIRPKAQTDETSCTPGRFPALLVCPFCLGNGLILRDLAQTVLRQRLGDAHTAFIGELIQPGGQLVFQPGRGRYAAQQQIF